MNAPPSHRSLRERFAIGASLLPPVALLLLASRWGWVGIPARVCLLAMPGVIGLGMAFPGFFAPWYRVFSRVRSWLGGRLVFGLLLGIHGLVVIPMGFLMRALGQRPIDGARSGSSWVRSKGYGSLRDPF